MSGKGDLRSGVSAGSQTLAEHGANIATTTTYFVGAHYEVANGAVTKYYFAGGQRIAMRNGGTLYFVLGKSNVAGCRLFQCQVPGCLFRSDFSNGKWAEFPAA